MLRSLLQRKSEEEAGQALPMFGLMFMILIGFVAMSIDVGRYVWARTAMQAGVDAAAVAAAQDMPNQTQAEATAAQYWVDNSGFIQSSGQNVTFTVSYPPGNKRIRVRGEADIPTWFAKFFGVDKWHVSAEGDAEAQVLDIAVVLDVSGSMCYDPPMLHVIEDDESQLMSPGNGAGRITLVDGNTSVAGAQDIPASSGSSIVIEVSSVSGLSTSSPNNRILIHSGLNGTGSYEIFVITNINSASRRLTVNRAQQNQFNDPNTSTSQMAHPVGAEVWRNRTSCAQAARSTTPPYQVEPFDGTVAAAEYFTTLFNPSYDKIGAAKYSDNTASITGLSSNLSGVKSSIHNLVPPTGTTNIAGGLAAGRIILDGAGKRANAVRVLVLLTDGIANYVCGSDSTYGQSDYNNLPCSSVNSEPQASAQSHAYNEAARATSEDIIIFTIGLGNGVDANFLKRVADGGGTSGPCQDNQQGCRYYFAPTTDQLDEAFEAIAEQTHIALVR